MLQSSLGFHTVTLSMPLLDNEYNLVMDFKKYSQQTGGLQMYPDRHGNEVIKFHKRDRGIEWLIRSNVWHERLKMETSIVEVKINPKILGGARDYINAADCYDMNVAITNFNDISKEISPLLYTFRDYTFKRIDYCVNFSLDKLVPGTSYEQVMALIKRSDIPPHYVEWMIYDDKAHRMKTRPSSFYLVCKSANINCYSKYMKLLEQSEKNIRRGYPPIPQETLDKARNIIRFEVQCKSPKTYALYKQAGGENRSALVQYRNLLSHRTCSTLINSYYNATIGAGDWFCLSEAKKIIERHKYHRQKEERLIDALREVSQCRSLASAKAKYQGSDLAAFKRTLKDLADIGINPVTIPRAWGISHIPNLLHTFNDKDDAKMFCSNLPLI